MCFTHCLKSVILHVMESGWWDLIMILPIGFMNKSYVYDAKFKGTLSQKRM